MWSQRRGRSADLLVRQGDDLLAAGDLGGAKVCYERAVERDGRHAEALRSLAYVLLQEGDAEQALAAAERALAAEPDLAGVHGLLGNVLMALERFAEAVPHLIHDAGQARGREQILIRGQVGMCYERLGDLEAAERWLRLALEHEPAYMTRHSAIAWYDHSPGVAGLASLPADLHHALARVLQRCGDADQARLHYHLAKRIDPTIVLDRMYLDVMSRADLENHPGEPIPQPNSTVSDEERLRYLLSRPTYPELAEAARLPGMAGIKDGVLGTVAAAQRRGSFVEAAQLWVVVQCLTGVGWPDLHALLAAEDGRRLMGIAESTYAGSPPPRTARELARRLPLDAASAAAMVDLVEVFLQLDLPTGTTFTEVVEAAAGARGPELRFLLGRELHRAGRLTEARQHLEEAANRQEAVGDLDNARFSLALLARLAADEERFDDALRLRRRVIEHAETQGDRVQAIGELIHVAWLLTQTGDPDGGYRAAEQLANRMLDDPEVRNGLGPILGGHIGDLLTTTARAAGVPAPDPERLHRLAATNTDTDIDDVHSVWDRAHTLAAQEQWAEAVAEYDRALHYARFSPRTYDILPILLESAEAADQLGERDDACGRLERALELTFGDPDRERENEVLLRLSRHHLSDDPDRALAIAAKLFRAVSPDDPLMMLANEAVHRWGAGDYPADLLGRIRDELGTPSKGAGWTMKAMMVASTAEHVGAAVLAEELSREIITQAGAGERPDLHATMWARRTLGDALLRHGEYTPAAAELERAVEEARRLYDVRTEAGTLSSLAEAHLRLGYLDQAAAHFDARAALADRFGDVTAAATARVNAAHMFLLLGRADEAITRVEQAINGFGRSERADLVAFALRLLVHHIDELPAHLQDMADGLDDEITGRPGEPVWLYALLFRARRRAVGDDPAAAMVRILLPVLDLPSGTETGFVILARLEAATLLRQVALTRAWLVAENALQLADRDSTQLFVRVRIRELLLDLGLRLGQTADVTALLPKLEADWRLMRRTLVGDADRIVVADRAARLLGRAASTVVDADPGTALRIMDSTWSAALADQLAGEERAEADEPEPAVLAIALLDGHVVAMLRPAPGAAVRADRTGLSTSDANKLLATFRREMHLFQGHGSTSWTRTARAILAGVGPDIPHDTTLLLIVDPALQELPMHAVALPDGQLLVERATVVYAPSLAAYHELRRRQRAKPATGRMVSVGIAFPDEARAIGIRIGAPVLSGNRLDKSALRERIADADLIHFAAHGRYDPHVDRLSGLLLTTEETEAGPQQILSIRDLDAWQLHAGLVTLSACESGLGSATPSDYLGLARQMLGAGADTVLSALWKIDDAATQDFMIRFYHELLGAERHDDNLHLDVAAALRRTQLATFSQVGIHRWAGFRLTGLPTVNWRPRKAAHD